ncbi:3-oxoacyl-[acyl-carrier-protein] reductase FabG [Serratia quinivorans]|jgi:NAD(P)-dependent dehydrogenase (short-subunit alcohol dehydrogenase family)|uniref:oxidoreductase n=1 Tax=Serratia quinivorans TaxID=137545 RepID=UPI00217B64B0|nr:oxidoreductase [Serratia quinivorans]CAI0967705.1 3-oxoacyl-[acyl-carrier-protein] reductase FabG [Serratia quinivorans]CAI0985913.1 3-oxoacyl-[acyl-carrier-protein] reductase FabG [Serratia quinivorans]CAI1871118.1 3-oxoacyl-[acyl-carrier-protein] reductase FabG [Serratia quinivorans]CAI1948164.1 3-oxoacyl-[acyl-carrier-protein] reductase FabG [Serratia quinivorans]CAI2102977.1 3-oxoacyl-[acyl-carrier-protein] reductase FabG [Serratia quinivorans]
MNHSKLFFITGVSSGLGRALAEEALNAGHRVVGTLRNQQAKDEFEALAPGRSFGRILDVTHFAAIAPLVNTVEQELGAVDVLVNNAGYGHEGTMEESPLTDAIHQFEVNVFGAVAVIKAFLPYFRARRAGHILNVTSMGGFITLPGISYYCGSKFALQGISETLTKELKPFNIAVTAIQPGAFRTDWAGRSMVRSARSISDYDQSFGPIRETREKYSGNQPGNPMKAAQAILQLINTPEPPALLLLGSDALMYVREKLHQMNSDIDAWETVSRSTDG